MLFGYPIAATENNWVHDCLSEAIRAIHSAIDANTRYPAWPNVLPLAHQQRLKSRRGLRERFKIYDAAVRELTKNDRDVVLDVLDLGNRIADLLSGQCDCPTIENLPESVRDPISSLFGFAFDLLSDLAVRDQQYAAIYAAIPAQVCPFCGVVKFDPPGMVREAMDHYLNKSLYTFAAANLRNLVPMCHKCNSSYKLAKDLLRREDGSRRVAFDPYNHTLVSISIDNSDPFDGTSPDTPNWSIQFEPDTPAVTTWDEVFSLRQRYRHNELDQVFRSLLELFRNFAKSEGMVAGTVAELVTLLRSLEDLYRLSGLQDRAFLKAAVFRMLRLHCEAGNTRLLKHLRSLVRPASAHAEA